MSSMVATKGTLARAGLPADASLLDLVAFIRSDPALLPRRRNALIAGLEAFAAALALDPEVTSAQPAGLSARLIGFAPRAAGLSPGRWKEVLRLTRASLERAGMMKLPGRYPVPLTPAWEKLFKLVRRKPDKVGLSRFIRFCSLMGIAPRLVDDRVFAAFLELLVTECFIDAPREVHRTACRLWNESAVAIVGWPRRTVTIPDYRDTYTLPWTRFPRTLKADADRYLDCLAGKAVRSGFDAGPLRPSTVDGLRQELRGFASALVRKGTDPVTLSSLANMVSVSAVRRGLAFLLERNGGETSVTISRTASSVTAAARDWVIVDDKQLAQLTAICKRVAPPRVGLADATRLKLSQFDCPEKVQAVLDAPRRLLARARSSSTAPAKAALDVQAAVAVELLLMAPLPLRHLARLSMGKHVRHSSNGRMSIAVGAAESGRDQAIEFALPEETTRLVQLYVRRYRPSLCPVRTTALFPGRLGLPKSDQWLGIQVSRCILEITGLAMTPKLFRHFAAKHYLDAHPGAFGVLRYALGHKSIQTTTEYYSATGGASACVRADEQVLAQSRTASRAPNTSGRLAKPTSIPAIRPRSVG